MNPNDMAKKIIFDLVVKKAIAKVILAVPFLGLPVVNPVFVYVAQKLFTALYNEIEFEGELLMIGIKTDFQDKKYKEATTALGQAIKQGKTDEELQKAHDEFKKRLHDLISLKP